MSVLSKISAPIGFSDSTGLSVYDSYTASSGFNYYIGARTAGDILIVEQVTEGTACCLLSGILIYNRMTNTLLREIELPKFEHYTRQKVCALIKENLLDILISTTRKEGIELDEKAADAYIDDILDTCYFEQSRKSVLDWAKRVGIIKPEIK